MRELLIETPEGLDLRHELAGPGSRSAAALTDLVLFLIGWTVLSLVLALLSALDPTGVGSLLRGLIAFGTLLLLISYFFVFGSVWRGQTPGKRLLGIRVNAADGYPASTWQLFVRSLFFPIELMMIGLVFMLVTQRVQRIGDLVAGTVVLREPRALGAAEPFPGENWSGLRQQTLPLVPALAARLDAEDQDFLRGLLARRDLAPEERRRLYVSAAGHYAKRLDLGPFQDARVVLKELYLFLRESRGRRAGRR